MAWSSKSNFSASSGFTLIEMIVVVGITVIIASMGYSAYRIAESSNQMSVTQNAVAIGLRRAQTLSQSVDSDSIWGTKIQNGSVVVFKGVTYATRDTTRDEKTPIPSNITPSGVTEVEFSKMYGLPLTTGTITLTAASGAVKTVAINAKGTVSY